MSLTLGKSLEFRALVQFIAADQIAAEHLKIASPMLCHLSGFMTRGRLPDSMLSVTLGPIIKNKAGKVGRLDNYRPIALGIVFSIILDMIYWVIYVNMLVLQAPVLACMLLICVSLPKKYHKDIRLKGQTLLSSSYVIVCLRLKPQRLFTKFKWDMSDSVIEDIYEICVHQPDYAGQTGQ